MYISWNHSDDVEEGISLKELSRRGSMYKNKSFQPEPDDIYEGEELAALKSSSDVESDDDIVVSKRNKMEALRTEKLHEASLATSLLGIDFWWEPLTQRISTTHELQRFFKIFPN